MPHTVFFLTVSLKKKKNFTRSYSWIICTNYFSHQSNGVISNAERFRHDVICWCSWPNSVGWRIIFFNVGITRETWKVLVWGGQLDQRNVRKKKDEVFFLGWGGRNERVMWMLWMIWGGSSYYLKPVEGVCKIHVAINHCSCSNHQGPSVKLLKNIIDSFFTEGHRIPALNLCVI